jgi:MFS family permease
VSDTVTPDLPSSRRILAGYFTLAGLYTLSAALIWGVNTLFLLNAGLSFFEVFVANAAFSAGTVVFEIPTGVIADTLGRRISFLLSVSVLGATTLLYVGLAHVGAGVVGFALASVLIGLGFTFYSGATEAWLVDALAATGYRGMLDRVFARGQQVTGAAMLVGTVGGGLLGQIDLSIPYLVRSVLLALVFVVAYVVMQDIGFTPRRVTARELPREVVANARAGVEFGWRQRSLRLLMLAGLAQSAFLMWGFYAAQPYLLQLLDSDAVWVAGLIAAGVALATIVGNQVVRLASAFCGRRTTFLLAAGAVEAVGAVVMGLTTSFWVALPALLLVMGSTGVSGPVRSSYLHQVVPTQQRATVVSFDSMISNVGGIGGQIGLGALGQARSIASAFVVGGVVAGTALPILGRLRRLGGAPDQIVGERAGLEGPCAGSGIPAVSGVDTHSPEEPVPSLAAARG